MLSLITVSEAQKKIAENVRLQRLQIGLTQQGLAKRSGVALPSLRKVEQKGLISLESFLKFQMVFDGLKKIVKSVEPTIVEFSSIDEVIKANKKPVRKRGNRR